MGIVEGENKMLLFVFGDLFIGMFVVVFVVAYFLLRKIGFDLMEIPAMLVNAYYEALLWLTKTPEPKQKETDHRNYR